MNDWEKKKTQQQQQQLFHLNNAKYYGIQDSSLKIIIVIYSICENPIDGYALSHNLELYIEQKCIDINKFNLHLR